MKQLFSIKCFVFLFSAFFAVSAFVVGNHHPGDDHVRHGHLSHPPRHPGHPPPFVGTLDGNYFKPRNFSVTQLERSKDLQQSELEISNKTRHQNSSSTNAQNELNDDNDDVARNELTDDKPPIPESHGKIELKSLKKKKKKSCKKYKKCCKKGKKKCCKKLKKCCKKSGKCKDSDGKKSDDDDEDRPAKGQRKIPEDKPEIKQPPQLEDEEEEDVDEEEDKTESRAPKSPQNSTQQKETTEDYSDEY
uniref:Uncharacterized protein n=1 Tax=Panagrolaimus superbus TaxID=310955 RepID=A0A914YQE5_9BILA